MDTLSFIGALAVLIIILAIVGYYLTDGYSSFFKMSKVIGIKNYFEELFGEVAKWFENRNKTEKTGSNEMRNSIIVLAGIYVCLIAFGNFISDLNIIESAILITATLSTITLAAMLSLFLGMFITSIDDNSVAAVFRFGQRIKYIVNNEDDLRKLVEVMEDEEGENKNARLAEQGKLVVATYIPLLTPIFNIRWFSWNPFDQFKKVYIYKHHWSDPEKWEETKDEGQKDKPVISKIDIAQKASKERFLWIDSVIIGYDANVELLGNIKVNYVRQNNIRIGDLDMIFLKQNGRFSSFVDQTLRGGYNGFLNGVGYRLMDGTVHAAPAEKGDILNFQALDLSESGPEFNEGIKQKISGKFAVIVLNSSIADWELSKESETIVKAIEAATSAKFTKKKDEELAKGQAAYTREELLAQAAGDEALIKQYGNAPEGVMTYLRETRRVVPETGSVIYGGGITPTFPVGSTQENKRKQGENKTDE